MKSAETKAKRNRDNFWNTVSIPYEDRELALWMKIIFGFIWAISILNGILYGAPVSYLLAMGMMVALLAGLSEQFVHKESNAGNVSAVFH